MAASSPRRSLAREAAIASAGILLLLAVVKHAGAAIPFVREHALTVAAAVQLYVPIMLIGRRGITHQSLGLTAATWRRDLALVGILALLTAVPFAIGHHFWQTLLFARPFHLRFDPSVLSAAALQIAVVAFPEELFFRGYLQGRLEELWPATRRVLGTPFGAAIVGAAAVFALAHFAGEYRPDRLGPFFPALVFGWLRTRTKSLVAPVAYHAFCNLLGDVLWTCYRP